MKFRKYLIAVTLIFMVILFFIRNVEADMLYINEFMADNDGIIEDPDERGTYEDWIELYNSGTSDIELGGMYLTDNLTNPTQWQIPTGVSIPADGFLLIWADGDIEQGNTHASFRLRRSGEEIGLFDKDENGNMAIDIVTYGEQTTDISYGRIYDGGESWVFFANSTPGYSNSQGTPATSSTTTTNLNEDCPAEEIYGECGEVIEFLRYFRDSVLSKTPAGQKIIKLYYQWSPVIIEKIQEDSEYKRILKKMIDRVLFLFR